MSTDPDSEQHPVSNSGIPDAIKLILYFAGVVVLGAAFAPILFFIGKTYGAFIMENAHEGLPILGWIAEKARDSGFPRYFNRSVLVAAVVLLVPALRWMHVTRADLPGLRPNRRDLGDAAFGFAIAFGLLLVMGALLLSRGIFEIRATNLQALLLTPLVAAVAVSLIEEWLFRGAFTGIVARAFTPMATLWTVALLFAVLHFMEPPDGVHIKDEMVGMSTGFQFAGVIFGQLAEANRFLASFLTLLAVGLILGWARSRTASLWLPIGLHAGWVFALKAFSAGTKRVQPIEETTPWIGRDLATGLLPLAFLAVTAAFLAIYLRKTPARAMS